MYINDFLKMKQSAQTIKMITCYDCWTAKIIADTNIDCVLVGDSASMVMHGFNSTINADVNMMEAHIRAVLKGVGNKYVIGDMPFLSYRKSLIDAMDAVEKIIRAGAHAVKLEGVTGNEPLIKHIVASGVPVMGHLGFTPQSINIFGKSIVQGKNTQSAQQLIADAKTLESLGCFALVLECIPTKLSKQITEE